ATQKFVDIEEIRDNTIILKNGAMRQVLMVSGLNFELKSEEEQGLITFAYQSFLNSLNFSVQIFIHSRRLNIEDYLKRLESLREQEANELLKNQIAGYRDFVQSFVSQNPIMEKTFFAIVPFDPIQIPAGGAGLLGKVLGIFRKEKAVGPSEEKEVAFQRHLQQLSQRTDQVTSGLNAIGLRAIALENEEIIELFYNLYNPEAIEKKTLEIAKQ
ncbi:MAG: hypothetical protein AAB646_00670, partial [Patescibacteria group bacterium]